MVLCDVVWGRVLEVDRWYELSGLVCSLLDAGCIPPLGREVLTRTLFFPGFGVTRYPSLRGLSSICLADVFRHS